MQRSGNESPKTHQGRARIRRVGGALIALLASTLLSALLLEGGVLLFLGEQPRFPRHVVGASFGLRINEPGARYWHHSADADIEFRINRQGMRADRDYAYARPPGVCRILSLGDSFTVGYEVDMLETFSSVLERELRARGIETEVLNTGVSGYGTAEECLYLERELLRYEPDLVLVTFYSNDLVDNVRSGLFRLEGTRLVEASPSYVPGGDFGNWLNTNPLLGWLSENSNAFALAKERMTLLAKQRVVAANRRNLAPADPGSAVELELQQRLAGAIFERIYLTTRSHGVPLLIQSIPKQIPDQNPRELLDLFPSEAFDSNREGIIFFPARDALRARWGRTPLYHQRPLGHWTPEAHRLAGEALARIVAERHLLE